MPSDWLVSPSPNPEMAQNALSAAVNGSCGLCNKIEPRWEFSSRPVGRIPRTEPSPITKLTIMPECLLEKSGQWTNCGDWGMHQNVGREPEEIQGKPKSRSLP